MYEMKIIDTSKKAVSVICEECKSTFDSTKKYNSKNLPICSDKCHIKSRTEILENGCWKAIRYLSNPKRSSYATFKGKIPDRYVVKNTCENCECYNPDHLHIISHAESNKLALEKAAQKKEEYLKEREEEKRLGFIRCRHCDKKLGKYLAFLGSYCNYYCLLWSQANLHNSNYQKLSVNFSAFFDDRTDKSSCFKFRDSKFYCGYGEYLDWKIISLRSTWSEEEYEEHLDDICIKHNDCINPNHLEPKPIEPSILFKTRLMNLPEGQRDKFKKIYEDVVFKKIAYATVNKKWDEATELIGILDW